MAEINKEKGLEQYLGEYKIWDTAARNFKEVESITDFVAGVSDKLALKRKKQENLNEEQYTQAQKDFFNLLRDASPSNLRDHYNIIGNDALKEASEGLVKKVEEDNILQKVDEKSIMKYLLHPIKIDDKELFLFSPAKTEDPLYKEIAKNHAFYLQFKGAEKGGDPNARINLAIQYHGMVYGSIQMPQGMGIGYLNNLYQLLAARADQIFINGFAKSKDELDKDKIVGYAKECLKEAYTGSKAKVYSIIAQDYVAEKAK